MLKKIYTSILKGHHQAITEEVDQALKADVAPVAILNEGMISAMEEVGRRFESGQSYLPEMLIAANAMQKGMKVLGPALIADDVQPVGCYVIGTVEGDLHDIGKNLVGMMMEGAGFKVVDLGINVPAVRFVEAIREHRPHILGLSALLTTTMPQIGIILRAVEEAGLRDGLKVMIGGAPVTQRFADEIGADIYAPDAAVASSLAKNVIQDIAH